MKSIRIELAFSPSASPPFLTEFFRSPELDRELILGGQAVDGIETITSYVYGSTAAYEDILVDRNDVLEFDITPAEDGFFSYLRRELSDDGMSLLNALSQRTIVVIPPIEVRSEYTVRMTLVGHPDGLRDVLSKTPEDISQDVRSIRDGVTMTLSSLSKRQREALQTAWRLGYYEVPRQNGIETVAGELGCAVSTASELIRRAESKLISESLNDSL